MIILSEPYGDNSNILFQNLHFDAFCHNHGLEFINPFMAAYAKVFPGLRFENNRITLGSSRLRLMSLLARDFNASQSQETARNWLLSRSSKTTWVKGWGFRSYEDAKRNRPYFQKTFTPMCNEQVKTDLEKLKRNGKILSVHMRRGNYRAWAGGKYYYDDATYACLVRRVLDHYSDVGTVQIFSNEPIDLASFRSLDTNTIVHSGPWYEDQWRMALSDMIVGPPSTFSLWASFIGETPVWNVETPDSPVAFRVSGG